jgi:hypothetical protein
LITLTVSLVGGVGDPLNSSCHKGLSVLPKEQELIPEY